MEQVVKQIAYCYYEKFRDLGYGPDPKRDWTMAEKAFKHIIKPQSDFYMWKQDEEDYGEFRKFL